MWNLFYQWQRVKGFLQDQKGQGMVEYALILGLIVVGAIAAFRLMGTNVASIANNAANSLHQ